VTAVADRVHPAHHHHRRHHRRRRVPRHQRARFQQLPLPVWVRMVVLTTGWLLIVVGVVGLFLPILQGGLSLALGFALLSLGSQWMHLRIRKLMGRWPRLWRRMERFRRRLHGWLHRATVRADGAAVEAAAEDDTRS
jgi:hypothetical protein